MTKKTTTIGSDTWEWEETDEVREAIKKLHATNRLHDDIRRLEEESGKKGDYGVGK